jgi:hypothetical protein
MSSIQIGFSTVLLLGEECSADQFDSSGVCICTSLNPSAGTVTVCRIFREFHPAGLNQRPGKLLLFGLILLTKFQLCGGTGIVWTYLFSQI